MSVWSARARRRPVGTTNARRVAAALAVAALLAPAAADSRDRPGTEAPRAAASQDGGSPEAPWPQWGGPTRNFIAPATRLADAWPEGGPPVVWDRPLGVGHSAIVSDGERLFTMYRVGDGRSENGPFEAEETVIALDAATGETVWEHTYASRLENFEFGAGPHSTPLIVGERLFTFGTNKQLHAFDRRTGEILWSVDLVEDLGAPPLLIRPVVKAGYGCSPLAWRDTLICSVGGPGQSVVAFRQEDGSVAWRGGDFLFSQAPPALIDVDGQVQLAVVGGATVNGMDPDTGDVLWAVPHDPGNDLNMLGAQWGDDGVLFVSSGYRAGSQGVRLARRGGITETDELWFSSEVQFMFLNTVRIGEWVYGTDGTFGPAFMTAVHAATGEVAWQQRGFNRSTLLWADGKFIVLDEDGDLALATMSPDGMEVLARAPLFETTSWTVPTLVGTTLYARDRERIVALDLGAEE